MDHDLVRALFNYDPATGLLTRRVKLGSRSRIGEVVGNPESNGYLKTSVGGKNHPIHRLAWLWVHGVWPTGEIDHIDRDNTNNRLLNLRDVSTQVNLHNKSTYSSNWSGSPGVCWYAPSCKWVATISANRKRHHLGYFDDKSAAIAAYTAAKQTYHPTAPKL